MKPFDELKRAEELVERYKPSGDEELDYRQLVSLLAQERVLDAVRADVFENYEYDSDEAGEYVFREYMVRHNLSVYAATLDKNVTDRITGENPEEKSFVAICVKNREIYPKPKKRT